MIELIDAFVRPLQRSGCRYLVTGSVASIAYGEPRLTNDIDLVLDIGEADVADLIAAFPPADYYLPPADVIHCERVRTQRGHFNIIHQATMLKADVYLSGADSLHRWAFERPRVLEIDSLPVGFAPPEYVIIRKLEFHREGGSAKHLRDIAAMLRELGPDLDTGFLDREIHARGLLDGWQQANALKLEL